MAKRCARTVGVVSLVFAASACHPILPIAAANGDASEVRWSLDQPGVYERDNTYGGATALIAAAGGGYVDIVKMLLDKGADANARVQVDGAYGYRLGCTALMLGAANGRWDIVKLLIPRVSDINAVDAKGESALYKAVANQRIESIRLLLAAGADPAVGDVWTVAEKAGRRDLAAELRAAKRGQPSAQPEPPPAASPSASSANADRATASGTVVDMAYRAAAPQPAAYALIVGIDHYRDVPAATGARTDAERFAELAKKTLGLRDDHVRVALDDHATKTDVLGGLEWLEKSVSPGGRVYFFFSGHGAPTPDASTFLVPYDGKPKNIAGSAVAMSDVMKSLARTKARDVLAIVDSCFSGAGGRSVLPPGARPLMRVKEEAPSAQLALFTASQGDEISGPAPGEAAGVFTKFVVQALGTGQADQNGDGQVSLQELADWVGPRVARDAKKDGRDQHPKVVVGSGVGGAQGFIVEYGLATK